MSKRIDPIFNEKTLIKFYQNESNSYRKELTNLLINNFNNNDYYDRLKNDIKFGHYFKKMEKVVENIKNHNTKEIIIY